MPNSRSPLYLTLLAILAAFCLGWWVGATNSQVVVLAYSIVCIAAELLFLARLTERTSMLRFAFMVALMAFMMASWAGCFLSWVFTRL